MRILMFERGRQQLQLKARGPLQPTAQPTPARGGIRTVFDDDQSSQSADAIRKRAKLLHKLLNATTVNVTVTPSYLSSFATAWTQVVHERANTSNFAKKGVAFMQSMWHNLTNVSTTPGSVTLFNIGALDCSDGDNCIGMTRAGVCACYHQH